MKIHANAALGPAGRIALCELIDQGMTLRAAAAALSVSPATAHRWWHRRRLGELLVCMAGGTLELNEYAGHGAKNLASAAAS